MMEMQLPRYLGPNSPTPLPAASEDERNEGVGPAIPAQILVVEDDYFVGLVVEEALQDAGYEVLAVVTSGEEAIRLVADSRPALVLMDIRLSGEMSGIEAALELRQQGVVSIFASAHSDPATRSAGNQAKPAGWLTKPFSAPELISAVDTALAKMKQH